MSRVCTKAGCSVLVTRGRCAIHQAESWGRPAARTVYGPQWVRLRYLVRQEEPYCRLCGNPTAIIDHIIPKSLGGTDDRSNLQGLCTSCSNSKSGREGGIASQKKRRG